jgi:membrane associated rhomboid family serine protease
MLSITLIIIALTAIISFSALSNQKVTNDLIFYPPAVTNQNQWYRFFSCALIHADIPHLLFNMWGLYIFGENLENAFAFIFPGKGGLLFVALYLFSQFFCLVPTYLKNKDNHYYRSLGASGAVSGVVFASIILFPTAKLGLLFIPIGIPGFIFGLLYLAISYGMAKKGTDNINHEAHFFGALAGAGFVIASCYAFSGFDPVQNFVGDIREFLS